MENKAPFVPEARATLIGSLPHLDHEEAQDLVLKYIPEIPIWVQLPHYPEERLLTQFVEGFPGVVQQKDKIFFDTDPPGFEEDLLAFFQEYLEVKEGGRRLEDSRFALSHGHGKGFYCFLAKIKAMAPRPFALKGQITGPFTMLTGLKEKSGKMAYYNPQLKEAICQGLALKAAFQAEQLRKFTDRAILFLDEPALAGFGSSQMVGIKREDVQQDLKIVIEEIHARDTLCGVHVCANTEWSLLLDPEIPLDIVSFDAYGFMDKFLIYKEEIRSFMERGGIVAWGLVPTQRTDDIRKISMDEMLQGFFRAKDVLGIPEEQLIGQALITPSCGTGLLEKDLAQKVLELTARLSEAIRTKVFKG